MITSLINKQFWLDNMVAIIDAAHVQGIGNVVATDLGTVFRVRGLDARLIPSAEVYLLPERDTVGTGNGKRQKTDEEYRNSVSGDLMSAINRVKANVFDAVVFGNDENIHVMSQVNGWPELDNA